MEPAIRKRAFADRAVTRTFRVKLTQIDTVVWTPEKTRHCRIDGSDCGEAKKELALRAEAYGLAIDFLTAPSFHFGLRLHTQRGETLLDPSSIVIRRIPCACFRRLTLQSMENVMEIRSGR